jgi:CHASE3 domain sensor protein
MRGGLTERTVVAGGLLALVIGAAFAILLSSVADLRADQRRSLQSEGVLVAANRLERLVIDLETAQRGFLLTGQEEFLEPWTSARTEYPDQAATLQQLLTDGDPDQRARAGRIVRAADSYLQDYSIPTVEAARRDRAAVQVDPVSLQASGASTASGQSSTGSPAPSRIS